MNRTGNPGFSKIRNRDNTALNAKKAETANVKALSVYDQLAELKDDPRISARIQKLLADEERESVTLKQLCAVLQYLDVPTPSGMKGRNWQPNTVRRLRVRILALRGVDILRLWAA